MQASNFKTLFKLDITESGGVSPELKLAMINMFKSAAYYILVEEGGEGFSEHYHLHGIISSNYSRSDNFRSKTLKPVYVILKKELTPWGVHIKEVTHLPGALSYVIKDERVLVTSGIDLGNVPKWQGNPKTHNRLSGYTRINKHNFVSKLVNYIDATGLKSPSNFTDIRNVIQDMMKEKYIFDFGGWTRSRIGQILVVYGTQSYALSYLDDLCNFEA